MLGYTRSATVTTLASGRSTYEDSTTTTPKPAPWSPAARTKIAVWMLDTDYDGRSLYPRQVFFPMAGPRDGWSRLAKNLKAEIDEDLIEDLPRHSLPTLRSRANTAA